MIDNPEPSLDVSTEAKSNGVWVRLPSLQPGDEAVAERFANLVSRTACPYANNTRFVVAPSWLTDRPILDNIQSMLPAFNSFVSRHVEDSLDMFVIGLRDHPASGNPDELAKLLKTILESLACYDSLRQDDLTKDIDDPSWDFVYGSMRFFVPVFAPYYPLNHPRYSQSPACAFIVFQPDNCFRRKDISSKSPNRGAITSMVRDLFLGRGFSYDISLVTHPLKAARYIKPLPPERSPIYWWQEKPDQ